MNTKLALLFVIIAVGYIQCESMVISESTDFPVNPPFAKKVNATVIEQAEFVAFLNSHVPSSTEESAVKTGGMDSYYKWLNFLKSSTLPTEGNVTVHTSPNAHNVTVQSEIFTSTNSDDVIIISKTS